MSGDAAARPAATRGPRPKPGARGAAVIGASTLALVGLLGLAPPSGPAPAPAPATPDADPKIALCEAVCPHERDPQRLAECCAEAAPTANFRAYQLFEGAAHLHARALAEAVDDEAALAAARGFYQVMARAAVSLARELSSGFGEGGAEALERVARDALALPIPASIAGDRKLGLRPEFVAGIAVRALTRRARELRIPRSRRRLTPQQARASIDRALEAAELLARVARIAPDNALRFLRDAGEATHEAFMVAIQLRRIDLVCPAILALTVTSPALELDAKICRGDVDDREALRETLDRMPGPWRADVEPWRRHLRLGHPLQSAAIAGAALGLASASSALLLHSRYLALCGHINEERRCVDAEPANAAAARRASIAFGVAAPALVATSVALFVLRAREKRARQRGRCLPLVSGDGRGASASFACRF